MPPEARWTTLSAKAIDILDAAEQRLRSAGYNGFSFRDLAADVGIKSASVHHHFPTKEALVAQLSERYADRFIEALATAPSGLARIAAYRDAFRQALGEDCGFCLCGMLGAESGSLPDPVRQSSRATFERMIDDLAQGLGGAVPAPRETALAVIAQLEGAMILARAFDDPAMFDRAAANLAAG